MTREQTRLLGIEFERRIMEIYPDFKVKEKLDTDTIYSFLSEYSILYVDGLILASSNAQSNNAAIIKINDVLKTLICHCVIQPEKVSLIDNTTLLENDTYVAFRKPSDYFRYIRSSSVLSKCQGVSKNSKVQNQIVRQQDVTGVMETYVNIGNIIRYPLVVWESTKEDSYIKVIHDKYTEIDGLDLIYYKYPYRFNILNYDNKDAEGSVHDTCILPVSTFDDIVDGAVQLYISKYKFLLLGGNKSRQQLQQQPEQQAAQQAEQ